LNIVTFSLISSILSDFLYKQKGELEVVKKVLISKINNMDKINS